MDIAKLIENQEAGRERFINEQETKKLNEVLIAYDKELMEFRPNINISKQWPSPIRKRECTK